MRDARSISSPMDPNEKLSSNDNSGLADDDMQSDTDSWWVHLSGYSTPD